MIISLIIIAFFVVSLGALGIKGFSELGYRRKYELPSKKVEVLSTASRGLMVQYLRLPEANRPVPNLYHMLVALDTKFPKVDEHFMSRDYVYRNGGRHYKFDWDCGCWRDSECDYMDYKNIRNSIAGVRNELAKQEHALALHRVSGGLEDVKELTTRLKEEQELIQTVTKELT